VLSDVRTELLDFHQLNDTQIENRYDGVAQQLQSIDDTAADAAAILLAQVTDGSYMWASLVDDGIKRAAGVIKQVEKTTHDPAFHRCVLRVWSAGGRRQG
jgi:molybdate-binding protein